MIKPLLMLLILTICSNLTAQDTSAVYQEESNFILYQLDITDTLVFDHNGTELYHYHDDLIMTPEKDTIIRFQDTVYTSLNMVVHDINGDPMLSLSTKKILDINQDVFGFVDHDGVIRDMNYAILAYQDGGQIKSLSGDVLYRYENMDLVLVATLVFFLEVF